MGSSGHQISHYACDRLPPWTLDSLWRIVLARTWRKQASFLLLNLLSSKSLLSNASSSWVFSLLSFCVYHTSFRSLNFSFTILYFHSRLVPRFLLKSLPKEYFVFQLWSHRHEFRLKCWNMHQLTWLRENERSWSHMARKQRWCLFIHIGDSVYGNNRNSRVGGTRWNIHPLKHDRSPSVERIQLAYHLNSSITKYRINHVM